VERRFEPTHHGDGVRASRLWWSTRITFVHDAPGVPRLSRNGPSLLGPGLPGGLGKLLDAVTDGKKSRADNFQEDY